MKKYKKYLLLTRYAFTSIITFSICLSSCKKFIQVDPPIDRTISQFVFSNDQTATAAVIGIYSQMLGTTNYFAAGGVTKLAGLSSDELLTSVATDVEFYNNSITTTNSFLQTYLWSSLYNYIYQANACIEGLNNSTSITNSTKQQLQGEAKFIRAFCYFYLVNLFGDVPLITSTAYQVNSLAPRDLSTKVYNQIVSDLIEAQNLLPAIDPTAERVRPNKWVAKAFLARVYLFQNNYANAESLATEVINSGNYSLEPNLNNIFLANSTETIWQMEPVASGLNTAEGFIFLPANAFVIPRYRITSTLINSFEPFDNRKTAWIKSNIVAGQTYYYPYKYKIRFGTTLTKYCMIFRLAEQYLIRSESRAQQNNISGAQADLNVIRNRAGLANTAANTKSAILLAIEHERQIEFLVEWGHRWLDLKRTGRIDAVLSSVKTMWTPSASLYPIPLSQIQANPRLTQNPGY